MPLYPEDKQKIRTPIQPIQPEFTQTPQLSNINELARSAAPEFEGVPKLPGQATQTPMPQPLTFEEQVYGAPKIDLGQSLYPQPIQPQQPTYQQSDLTPLIQKLSQQLYQPQVQPQQPQVRALSPQEVSQIQLVQQPTPEPERGLLGDILSATARGFYRVPEMGLQAIEAFRQPEPGKLETGTGYVLRGLEDYRQETPFLQQSKQERESYARRSITGAIENVLPSLVSIAPGIAASIFTGGLAAPVLGALSSGFLFGASTYTQEKRDAFDEYQRQGYNRKEAMDMAEKYAVKPAIYEGGIQFIFGIPELLTLGLGKAGTEVLKDFIKQPIKTILKPGVKSQIKKIAKTIPMEVVEEDLTAALQDMAKQEANLPAQGVWNAIKEATGPSLLMPIMFGAGVSGLNTLQRRQISNSLTNPDVSPQERTAALNFVTSQLNEQNPVAANMFNQLGQAYIAQGQAIDLETPIQQQLAEATEAQRQAILERPEFKEEARQRELAQRLEQFPERALMPIQREITPYRFPEEVQAELVEPEAQRQIPHPIRQQLPYEPTTKRITAKERKQIEYQPVTPEGNPLTPQQVKTFDEDVKTATAYTPMTEEEIQRAVEKIKNPKMLYDRDTLLHARSRIEAGEPGRRQFIESETGATEVIGIGSTYPEWFQNKGYKKKDALKTIDKALIGKTLTTKDKDMLNDLSQGAQEEINLMVEEEPETAPTITPEIPQTPITETIPKKVEPTATEEVEEFLPEAPEGKQQISPENLNVGDVYNIDNTLYTVEGFEGNKIRMLNPEGKVRRIETGNFGELNVNEVIDKGEGQAYAETMPIEEAFKSIPLAHELTWEEYSHNVPKADLPAARVYHRRAIRQAITQGLDVPKSVLKEYPDLVHYKSAKHPTGVMKEKAVIDFLRKEKIKGNHFKEADTRKVIKRFSEIEAHIRKIIPKGSQIRLTESLTSSAQTLKQHGLKSGKTLGRHYALANMTSAIELSLADITSADLDAVLYHESWHSVSAFLLNKKEREFINKVFPAVEIKPGRFKASEEIAADAFSEYVRTGKIEGLTELDRKGIYRIFDKMKEFIERLGNWLRGQGYQNIKDIFSEAMTGELKKRAEERGYTLKPELIQKMKAHYPNALIDEADYSIVEGYGELLKTAYDNHPLKSKDILGNLKRFKDAITFGAKGRDLKTWETVLTPFSKAQIHKEFGKIFDIEMNSSETRHKMIADLLSKNPSIAEVAKFYGVETKEVSKKLAEYNGKIRKAKNQGQFNVAADLQMERDRYMKRTQHSNKAPHEYLQLNKPKQEALLKLIIKSDAEQYIMNRKELEANGMDIDQVKAYYAWHKTTRKMVKMMVEQSEAIALTPYANKNWVGLLRKIIRSEDNSNALSKVHSEWKEGKPAKLDKFAEDNALSDKEKIEFIQAFNELSDVAKDLRYYRNEINQLKFYFMRVREGKYAIRVLDKNGNSIHHDRTDWSTKARAIELNLKKAFPEAQGYEVVTGEDKYVVTAFDRNGELLQRERTISPERAKQIESDLQAKYAEEGVTTKTEVKSYSPLTEGIYQELSDVAIQKFLERAIDKAEQNKAIDATEAQEITKGLLRAVAEELNKRGFGRHKIKRVKERVITGYKTTEGAKLFTAHVASFSGYLTKQQKAYNFYRELQNFPADKPELFVDAHNYVKAMLRNSTKLDQWTSRAKNIAFMYYISGRLSAAAIQFTQNYVLGTPYLARKIKELTGKHGKLEAERRYAKAQVDIARGKITQDEEVFLNDMIDEGEATDTFIREQMQSAQTGFSPGYIKFVDFISKPFSGMERYNRKSALLAMYRLQKEHGATEEKAREEAKTYVHNTHFAYGKGNLPSWALGEGISGALIRSAYTFRSFTQNYLESIGRSLAKDAQGKRHFDVLLRSLAWTFIFGGLSSLPFIDDLLGIIERFLGQPIRTDMRNALKQLGGKDSWIGETISRIGFEGMPAALPGVDLSGSITIGLPFTGEKVEDTLYGVWGGMLKKASDTVTYIERDDISRAIESATPLFAGNVLKAIRLYTEGLKGRTGKDILTVEGKPMKLDTLGFALQMAGFRPEAIAEASKVNWSLQNVQNVYNDMRNDLYSRYRNLDNGDSKELMIDVQDYNKRAEELRGLIPTITNKSLRQSLTQRPEKRKAGYVSG